MSSTIPSGLRADIMRKRMEDKNTLTSKGSLYVGLGTSRDDTGAADVYNTTALTIGSGETSGYILMTQNSETTGLKWTTSIPALTIGTLNTGSGGIVNGGSITNSGNVTVGSNITLTANNGNISSTSLSTGDITSGSNITLTASTGAISSSSLNTGVITSAGITNTGNISSTGNLTNTGNITAGNNITLTASTGNIASSSLNTGAVASTGITNTGDITNSGDITNTGDITVGTDITLDASTGDISADTFNLKSFKEYSEMTDQLWEADTVIPTANAINHKIADIVASGETLINGSRGSF